MSALRIAAGQRVVGCALSVNAGQRLRDVRLSPAHDLLHDESMVLLAQRPERGA